MKTATILTAFLLAAGAANAIIPLPDPCTLIAVEIPCLGIVLGDIVVANGEEKELNNGTYVINGNVTVESGGRLEIILSQVQFTDRDEVIHVLPGGQIIIDGSDLSALPDGDPTHIRIEAGASAVVVESSFQTIGILIATEDAELSLNTWRQADPAIGLANVHLTIRDQAFDNNTVGIRVAGGGAQLEDLAFMADDMAIVLEDTWTNVSRIEAIDIESVGISSTGSQGTFTAMNIQDRIGPPTLGGEFQNTAGVNLIVSSRIAQWGTGLFLCNAQVTYLGQGNTFEDNLVDVVSC